MDEGMLKKKRRPWINPKDKSKKWQHMKKIKDLKARAVLKKLKDRTRNQKEAEVSGEITSKNHAAISNDLDAFLQCILDPLHIERKEQVKLGIGKQDGGQASTANFANEEGGGEKEEKVGNLKRKNYRGNVTSQSPEESESSKCAGKRAKVSNLSLNSGVHTSNTNTKEKNKFFGKTAAGEGNGTEVRHTENRRHVSSRNCDASSDFPVLPTKRFGADTAEEVDRGKRRKTVGKNTEKNSQGFSSKKIFYPFKKALDQAARQKAADQADRVRREEERIKAVLKKAKYMSQRRRDTRQLKKKTARGQPHLGNVVQVLLAKIKKHAGS